MNTPTTANIKRFKVKDTWKDYEVTLEVNLHRLTAERAELINNFWMNAEDRLDEENGDPVRTVIRLAGLNVIRELLEDDGADFEVDANSYYARTSSWALQTSEGWGGKVEGDDFGWCGIRVVAANVQLPDFDELALSEIRV